MGDGEGRKNKVFVNDWLAFHLENRRSVFTSLGRFLWFFSQLCFYLCLLSSHFVLGSFVALIRSRDVLALVIHLSFLLDREFPEKRNNNILTSLVRHTISVQNYLLIVLMYNPHSQMEQSHLWESIAQFSSMWLDLSWRNKFFDKGSAGTSLFFCE